MQPIHYSRVTDECDAFQYWLEVMYESAQHICKVSVSFVPYMVLSPVKTGSSRLGTDERGKCDNVRLSAACPSNEATIRSVVVAVA